jgi:hypothetical protein
MDFILCRTLNLVPYQQVFTGPELESKALQTS